MSNKVDTFSAQDPEMSTLSASQMSTPGFVSINAQDAELNGRLDRLNTNYQASPQTPTAVADKVIAAVGPLISQPVGPSASEDLVHSLKRSRDMTQGISAAQPTPQLAPVTAVQEPMATVPGPKAPMATTSTQNPTHDSETLDSGAPPLISSKVTDMPQTFDSSAIRASSLASSKELPLKVTCEEVPYEAFSDDSLHKRKFATDANISSSSANDLSQAQTQPITTITSVPVDAEEPTTFAPIAPMQYSKSREKGNHKEPSDSGSASKESDQPLPKGAAGVDTVNHQTARTPISTVPIQDRPSGQSTGETLESSHSGQIRAQTMFTAAPKSTSGITQDARGSLPTTPIQTHVPLSERYNKAVMTFGSTNPAFEKVSLPNVAANGTDRSTATITMSIDPGHILPSQRNINNIPGPNGSKTAMKRPMDSPQDSSPNLQAPGPNSQHPNWTFPIQPSNNGNPPTSGTTMPPRRGEPPTKKARTNSRDSSHSMGNTPQPLLAAQVHNPPPTATPSPTHHHKMPSTSTITPPSPPPTHQLITKEDGTSAISTTPSKSRYLARQQTAYISPRRIIKIFFYSRSGTIIPWEFHDFTLKSIFDILTSLFGKPASEKFAVKVSMMKGVFCDEHDCAEEKDCCKILRNWEKKTEGELVDWMDSAAMRCPYKRVDFLVSVWEEVGHSSLYYMARDGY